MPDSVRETVARIIDPICFEAIVCSGSTVEKEMLDRQGFALAKADAILAALPGQEEIERLRAALIRIANGYAGCDDFQDAQVIAAEALNAPSPPQTTQPQGAGS